MDIQEIKLSPTLSIYKIKYDWSHSQSDFIKKIDINYFIVGLSDNNTSRVILNCNEFKSIEKVSLDVCKKLSNINDEKWDNTFINRMWVYRQYPNTIYETYHAHKFPLPVDSMENEVLNTWTSCFYLKVPTDLIGDEGKIFFKDLDDSEFSILPEEGDILFFGANVLHKPKLSPNSKMDRITICSNYSFEIPTLKDKKTLM